MDYAWQNNFQPGDIGKSAGWSNNINVTMGLRLKSLTDPWFAVKDEPEPAKVPDRPREEAPQDTSNGDNLEH